MGGSAFERAMDSIEAAGKTPLQDGTRQSNAAATRPSLLIGQKTVDVLGHMVIEPLFGPGQFKRNGASVSFREQGVTVSIAQFLFDTAQEPLIAPTLTGILHDTAFKLQAIIARIGKLVCVQQAEKMRKLTGITTMRRSSKQQNTLSTGGKPF